MRQHGLAARARVAADQAFDVDGRAARTGAAARFCQFSSCTQCSTPNSAFERGLGYGRRRTPAPFSSAPRTSGFALSKNPSTAGVCPSFSTRVLSAWTRCQDGESTWASRLEWMSFFGPRPHSRRSIPIPVPPRPSRPPPPRRCRRRSWLAPGSSTPTQALQVREHLGLLTISPKCGEPISSSPSQTSTRFTGSFLPLALKACECARGRRSAGLSGLPHRDPCTPYPVPASPPDAPRAAASSIPRERIA